MFRIGSALFIPSYLTVILYRTFASSEEDGNFILMAGTDFERGFRLMLTLLCCTSSVVEHVSPMVSGGGRF
jgi:hypothetical protein